MVAANVLRAQDRLGRVLLIEKPSSYLAFAWPSLSFAFHPSAQRLALATDVPEAWKAQNRRPPAGAAGQACSRLAGLAAGPRGHVPALEADESAALAAAMAGKDFSLICERLAEHGPEDRAAFRAAGLIRAWIEAGLVTGIDSSAPLSG